jgi:hypothetical protein
VRLMAKRANTIYLGLMLIAFGGLGLAINLGYLQLGAELISLLLLALGGYFLISYFSGIRSALFPALLFIFLSIPMWLTLAGFDGYAWVPPLWVLAPGLAFLITSLQGGSYTVFAIPGGIISTVAVFLLVEEQWGISFETVLAASLIVIGLVILTRSRRSA